MKIFIVEDDNIIKEALEKELQKWGFETYVTKNFIDIIEEFNKNSPHLVLLDIMLPYFNGYHWCNEIRKVSDVPIVFLSSKSENMDMVMAMQSGADDYIIKPFDFEVFIAKIQAVLRRCYNYESVKNNIFNGIELDKSEMKILFGKNEIDLTKTEFQIMEVLFSKWGGYATRESIMERCWQKEGYIDDNTLAVNITRLRKKLNSIGIQDLIITKKNVGYALNKDYKTI